MHKLSIHISTNERTGVPSKGGLKKSSFLKYDIFLASEINGDISVNVLSQGW